MQAMRDARVKVLACADAAWSCAMKGADMNQGFGIETPSGHQRSTLQPAARYLVLIESAGAALARLFAESRQQIAEFDASTEEVASMTMGHSALKGATGPEWDHALAGHTAAERAAADVYVLSI